MKILLDTHIIIWYLDGCMRLTDDAVQMIEDENNEIYYSVASLWEIAIKNRKHKETFPRMAVEILHFIEHCGFIRLPIRDHNVLAYENLPDIHSDPFDCMLVAQAKSEGMFLMTHDKKLEAFGREVMIV